MQCSVGMCCDLRAEDESSNLVLDTHPLLTLPCSAVHVLGVYATHQPTEVCLMTQLQQVSCQPQCLTVMQVTSTVLQVMSTVMQVMSTVMQVMHIACSRSMCDTGALTKAYATAHLKAKSKAYVRAITK